MIRRLALGIAITVVAVNPTGALDPFKDARPSIPRQVVSQEPSKADVRAALAYVATVTSSPMWHRMIDTLSFPPDHARPCPYERLIRHTFPDWPDAVAVAWRESRCQADAANPASSARGIFQLLQSLHSHRYYSTGACNANEWNDAWCSVHAARNLYDAAGTSPWAVR